jgi:hypothetical protein
MRLWFDRALPTVRGDLLGMRVLTLVGVWLISGCAFDISHVDRVPTAFQATAPSGFGWTLLQDQSVSVGSGFPTKLRQGTRWQPAGHTPQGDVYRSIDQIVTVEGANIFEAMVVIQGNKVVGFYLPVEHSFVAATNPMTLPIER